MFLEEYRGAVMKCFTIGIFIIVCQARSIFMNTYKPYVYACQKVFTYTWVLHTSY